MDQAGSAPPSSELKVVLVPCVAEGATGSCSTFGSLAPSWCPLNYYTLR
jgi:hypothetical protein